MVDACTMETALTAHHTHHVLHVARIRASSSRARELRVRGSSLEMGCVSLGALHATRGGYWGVLHVHHAVPSSSSSGAHSSNPSNSNPPNGSPPPRSRSSSQENLWHFHRYKSSVRTLLLTSPPSSFAIDTIALEYTSTDSLAFFGLVRARQHPHC